MEPISKQQLIIKRFFDLFFATLFLLIFGLPILFLILYSSILFKKKGVFKQKRVGLNMKLFEIYKIRTYDEKVNLSAGYGQFLRMTKLNELPQFFNVLKGDMSLVGPRPDQLEFKEKLSREEQEIMFSIKPGVTGPASIFFIDEETTFLNEDDDEYYEILTKKVAFNKKYIQNYSIFLDVKYILITLIVIVKRVVKGMVTYLKKA